MNALQIVELIQRRRRQLVVHSYVYYVLSENIVSDDTWQRWANELVQLQAVYPLPTGVYDDEFEDWTGATGMHLPHDEFAINKARHLLQARGERCATTT
jgi:NAD-dependent DNA ligase